MRIRLGCRGGIAGVEGSKDDLIRWLLDFGIFDSVLTRLQHYHLAVLWIWQCILGRADILKAGGLLFGGVNKSIFLKIGE